jgi:hypothetical protein
MGDFKNEFSWSKSRADTFETCKRRYYINYYGYWGGWNHGSDNRELYIMKNLRSIPMWVGSAVHDTIGWVINAHRSGFSHPPEKALEKLKKDMYSDWNDSLQGEYRGDPKHRPGLLEHYYQQPLSDMGLEEAFDQASACLEVFYESSVFTRVLEGESIEIIQVENLDSIQEGGIKVWVVADLILKWNGWTYIVDWKTGKQSPGENDHNENRQLGIYAAYAAQKWNIPPQQIIVHLHNLKLGQHESNKVTPEQITEVEAHIAQSASAMLNCLADPYENIAREQDFPGIDRPAFCKYCNFQGVCL